MEETAVIDEKQALLEACVTVLRKNANKNHTRPGIPYPHQWLWDSCFIAIGLSHVNVERAKTEVESLFSGQWANGMVPHMIFSPDKEYKHERNIWQSWSSPYSPDSKATSGITQPPLLAEAIWRVGQKMPKIERIRWFKKLLPNLMRHHEWLYNERDPHREGLTLQIHPYETGLDSTPPWLIQLHEHSKPWWIELIEWLRLDRLVNLVRRDTRHIPPGQRMTNIDALMYWDVIRRFRRKHWDIRRILHRTLFAIEDVSFNSILVRNNQRLVDIAKAARVKVPKHLTEAFARTEAQLENLWDESTGQYYCRDFITHNLLITPTIGGLVPLYAGTISEERKKRLVDLLRDHRYYWTNHPIPTVPVNSEFFNPDRYWQGPTWINTNWLIIDGLSRSGETERAEELREKTIDLVLRSGCFEYFNPIDGTGLGAENFSWTAALIIDLLKGSSKS